MRTLKKTLCLVLALAMVMSLGVSAFAASAKDDYSDYTSVTAKHKEAVDVMTATGVFNGMGDSANSFAPNGTLTREQAAKIVTYMLMEKANADTLTAIVAPYSDVAADRWSAGAIAYCTNEGILAGVGGGKFDPEGTLTGLQFAKMLVCALGYDAKEEGLEGDSWAVNTAKLLIYAGLNNSLETVALTGSITREQAAQMALNAFQADTVKYDDRISASVGGVEISISGKAEPVVNPSLVSRNNIDSAATNVIQFAEQYQRKLSKVTDWDDFGRPGHGWTFDGAPVGTYIDAPAVCFTRATGEAAVKTALSGYTFTGGTKPGATVTGDFTGDIYTNTLYTGAADATAGNIDSVTTPAKAIADLTANGVSFELYADSSREITDIIRVQYGVTKVTNITTNSAGDKTYSLTGPGSLIDYADPDSVDTVVLEGAVAKDDIVTYATPDGTTYYLYPTTSFVGTQSAFNQLKMTITVDDTLYDVGTGVYSHLNGNRTLVAADPDFPNSDKEANYYLDQFGTVVYTEAIDTTVQYAAIDAIANASHLGYAVEAILVFTDGTTKTVSVSKFTDEDGATVTGLDEAAASNDEYKGVVCTYTVDDDGKYNLKAVPSDATAGEIRSDDVKQDTNNAGEIITEKGNPVVKYGGVDALPVAADANTIFVVKTTSSSGDEYKSYTGYASVPTISSASGSDVILDYAMDKNGHVAFVYIDASEGTVTVTADAGAGDIVYIKNKKYTTSGTGSNVIYYYEAIVNGEDTVLATNTTLAEATAGELDARTLYKVTAANDKGVATKLVLQSTAAGGGDDYTLIDNFADSVNPHGTVIRIGGTEYTFDSNSVVCIIDKNDNLVGDDIEQVDIETNPGDYAKVYVKTKTNADTKVYIEAMYVIKK